MLMAYPSGPVRTGAESGTTWWVRWANCTPLVRESFGLPDQPVCALEFDLDKLLADWGQPLQVTPISAHPPVYEDLAVVVDENMPAARVRDLIAQTGGALVRSVVLFDVYRGEQMGREERAWPIA